ncbi:hypothetical protein F2P56_026855 [Juglans regia]|uniref:Uncharacterized protein n=1 Tax=Juglans regia TaxID=51240 RepID=A0A833X0X5_JUGRE|nr:hypothetical protein F2P56_026855 [Juglans regia]
MWRSVKRGRRGRLRHSRPIICSTPDEETLAARNILRDEVVANEPTEAVGGAGVQEAMEVAESGEGNINTDPPIKKRGRGPARGALFERLRKVGKVPLDIKDGHRGPSCENASIFTGRVTWIVKVYADMRHESWSYVPEEEKQELIDRVRADFILDWTKDNHREMVVTHLSEKYKAYHYELHKIYLKYASHEEALHGGTPMVPKPVWELLCERWASRTFKEKPRKNTINRQKLRVNHTSGRKSFVRILEEKRDTTTNMIAFYRETHWSARKGKFINDTTKHNYNLMLERLNEKDSEEDVDEAAAEIFKDVLGFKSGYASGMGHMVIPEPSPSMKKNKAFMRLAEENEQNKSDAEMYKSKIEQMADIVAMKRNFYEYEKVMNYRVSKLEGNTESRRET